PFSSAARARFYPAGSRRGALFRQSEENAMPPMANVGRACRSSRPPGPILSDRRELTRGFALARVFPVPAVPPPVLSLITANCFPVIVLFRRRRSFLSSY